MGADASRVFADADLVEAADAAPGPKTCRRFAAEPRTWSLGAEVQTDQLNAMSTTAGHLCDQGGFAAETIDIDGDGARDLVITDDCDVGGVGTDRWKVHLAGDAGFSAEAVSWTLPSGLFEDVLKRTEVNASYACETGSFNAATLDIDGDARLDLVITDACDAGGVGTTSWRIHRNIGDRFAADPISWQLPDGLAPDQINRVVSSISSVCEDGIFRSTLADLNGDGAPELVITDNCDQGDVGTDRWLVHTNTGSGFAKTGVTWSLPPIFEDDKMNGLSTFFTTGCTAGTFAASLLDIDGDRLPDLVVTDNCDQEGVGSDKWHVYANNGSGFAADPDDWPLPPAFSGDRMNKMQVAAASICAAGVFEASTFDIDGDAHPDLVVTNNCDAAGAGSSHWLVYSNRGSEFAESPRRWDLPQGFANDQMARPEVSHAHLCDAGQFRATTTDLDGDGALELVVTDDCDVGGTGTSDWKVYDSVCD